MALLLAYFGFHHLEHKISSQDLGYDEEELKNSMNKWSFLGIARSSGYGPNHPDLDIRSYPGSSGYAQDELQVHKSDDLANKI